MEKNEKLLPEFDGLTVISHAHHQVSWGDNKLSLMSLQKRVKGINPKLKRRGIAPASAELAEKAINDVNLVPESWRPYNLIFPGTLFKNGSGKEGFISLYFFGRWTWDFVSLSDPLGQEDRIVYIEKKK